MKIVEYKIVRTVYSSDTTPALSKLVNMSLIEGREPMGGPFKAGGDYCQTMVKYADLDSNSI